MKENEIDHVLEAQGLRRDFEMRGLDLTPVWQPTPYDPALECRQLRSLLRWVEAYKRLGNREQMEAEGYDFPPIEPDCDPETDWLRFELWMKGKLGVRTVAEMLDITHPLLPPDQMTAEQKKDAITELIPALAALQIDLYVKEGMPAELIYDDIWEQLNESYMPMCPDTTWHWDGCSGCCPVCVSRPWCESGFSLWPEDQEAGQMVVPENVLPYLTDADLSLGRLSAD